MPPRPGGLEGFGSLVPRLHIRITCQSCSFDGIPLFLAREAKIPSTDNTEKMPKPVLIPARSL